MVTDYADIQTLIYIITSTAIRTDLKAFLTAAFIASKIVGAELGTAGFSTLTFIKVYACFLICIKLVSMVTGTTGPTKCMFTVMGTTTIVLLTAIDNFQFNPVTLFSISSQLKARVAGTGERSHCVYTEMATVSKLLCTLIYVSTGLFVFRQLVAWATGTPGHSIHALTDVGTSIPTCAGVHL